MSAEERKRAGLVALALAAVVAALGGGAAAAQAADAAECNSQCQLERAREATERYWQVEVATGEGFLESSSCGSSPAGTLGIQYANPARTLDQVINVREPESLIYISEGFMRVGRRLAALEYSVPVLQDGLPYVGTTPPDPNGTQPPPELFGRQFQLARARGDGLRWQYQLHVWLYSPNPDGLFADANPGEACDGEHLVAPHAFEETPAGSPPELLGRFYVNAEKIRDELKIPPELGLRPAGNGNPKDGEVIVVTRSRQWSAGDGPTTPARTALPAVAVAAPDWAGDRVSVFVDLYPFSAVSDNRELVNWMRQGMGVGSEVIAHSEDLSEEFEPSVGVGEPNYRFEAPDFELTAKVGDAAPTEGNTQIRLWHQGPRGMGLATFWHDGFRFREAQVEVTPKKPGTPLARLLGCSDEASSCDSVSADAGVMVAFTAPSPVTSRVSRDWWNPRHDVGTMSSVGF